ncbi:MAG: PAS/PAC sensor hybrid histidine kinase [Rhodospirillaceae bacterium]|nr:MAG: PAS/PAC sensor hybrid histidine kinase [Rhodospirillaceae bacterium]
MNRQWPASPVGRVGCDVVVVDDFQELATTIAEALRGRGLSTHVAFDGEAAAALARNYVPAVALIDCILPDIDGLQLIRQLGEVWSDTTFIAMSGDVGGISEDVARQLRIKAFLNKPLPIRVLAQSVERLVRSSRDRPVEREAPSAWISLGIGSPARRATPTLAKYPSPRR